MEIASSYFFFIYLFFCVLYFLNSVFRYFAKKRVHSYIGTMMQKGLRVMGDGGDT